MMKELVLTVTVMGMVMDMVMDMAMDTAMKTVKNHSGKELKICLTGTDFINQGCIIRNVR